MLGFSADGDAVAHGTVHIRDGTSNTVLIVEGPAQAACADDDGDGIAGITALEMTGYDPRTGDEVLVSFASGDVEMDERGEYTVWVRVGNLASEVTLSLLPLPAGPPVMGVR